ncbi:MAG: ATP-binding protein [Pseudomonadota bacterium]
MFAALMPTGLFGRSLIIIVAPMLLLQTVVATVFMERHWQSVTDRLSAAVVRDISGIVDVIETYPQDVEFEAISRIAEERFDLRIRFLEETDLPPPAPKPFFSILDSALSEQLIDKVGKPFWIDTVGNSDLLEIRIKLSEKIMRVYVQRSRAYASNTHIFMVWMVATASVLIAIAILFLRNQIRPIQRLAEAAERFGKGQTPDEPLQPRGAAEVRRATVSFLEMRNRIERALDQRTAMLAGVSHDLRTVLTRFRLQLAVKPTEDDLKALTRDVDDMQDMLQGYLDFARGDTGEEASDVPVGDTIARLVDRFSDAGKVITHSHTGDVDARVRPVAFGRLVSNLVSNSIRYADRVEIRSRRRRKTLLIEVHDDGPGIPSEQWQEVFKPFVRLDDARNLDKSGIGLGLAIALDIARTHGGNIVLGDSDLGGLKVTVTLPQ